MGYDDTAIETANITENFDFTGKASEYFSIWIVNVALTILTLGIYSAWAKVRTNQYFYSNTYLDGASFRYTARPIQILKGRIIAFAIFMAYYASSFVSVQMTMIILGVIMILVPAFVVMSMAFRLRNSVYRNVRFNFDKNFKQAYKVFIIPVIFMGAYLMLATQMQDMTPENAAEYSVVSILVIILLLAIFLMVPWWEYMITIFKADHSKFGDANFKLTATLKNYFGMYAKGYGLSILMFGGLGLIIAGVVSFISSQDAPESMGILIPVIFVFVLPVYLWMFAYFQTKRTNLVFGNLVIQEHKVQAELKVGAMMLLYLTNTLAIMFTLGLMMPWAKVRTARYKASVMSVLVAGDLGQFISTQAEHQSALGEEIGEMFDMDLGF